MAKKFDFTLKAVDKLRTHRADTSKNSLMQVTSQRIANDAAIKDLVDQKQTLISSPQKGKTLSEQLHTRSHIKLLESYIELKSKERERLLEIESLKRKDYHSKLKDQKAIHNLKDRQLAIHKIETNREENNALEEIALARHSK